MIPTCRRLRRCNLQWASGVDTNPLDVWIRMDSL